MTARQQATLKRLQEGEGREQTCTYFDRKGGGESIYAYFPHPALPPSLPASVKETLMETSRLVASYQTQAQRDKTAFAALRKEKEVREGGRKEEKKGGSGTLFD